MQIVCSHEQRRNSCLGEIFLGYARQVLEQAALIEEKYKHKVVETGILHFNTALFFCSQCICRLDQEYGSENTISVWEKLRLMRSSMMWRNESEIEFYLNEFNASVLRRSWKQMISNSRNYCCKDHIFLSAINPLAQKRSGHDGGSQRLSISVFEQENIIHLLFRRRCSVPKCVQRNIRVRDRQRCLIYWLD